MQKIIIYLIGISCIFLSLSRVTMAGGGVDNRIYASLLKKYVIKKKVNYDGFKKDEKLLDEYLGILGRTKDMALSKNDRFAFYINVYNAFTIKLVLSRYPGINSIKEIGGFFSNPWSKKFIKLQGKKVSLDYIEHNILRPLFKDPRVHFAINCASKSCPPLLNEPYEGRTIESQLTGQAKKFIMDKNNFFIHGNKFFISRIFKWYKEDFSDNPVLFIKQYSSDKIKKILYNYGKNIRITYLDYDWSLNR